VPAGQADSALASLLQGRRGEHGHEPPRGSRLSCGPKDNTIVCVVRE
jgi:hypothetical protein